ncbi:ATP binding protein [Aureococcus anophagefferens]|nr:ATP binding protein [Aureococcus anophagefferens]
MGPSRSLGKLCESSSEDEGEDIEMFSPPSKKSFFDSSSDDDSECDEPPKKKTKPFSPAQPRVDADGADAPADAFACADPEALTAAESDAFLARARAARLRLSAAAAPARGDPLRAGVPAGWPRAIVGGDCNETMASAALTEDRHAVLGDEMGLGKTVETLAACQWQQHLAKLEAAVHLYGGADRDAALERTLARHADHADRGERALYVLLTRYTLMNAVRKGCDFSSPRNCALFPRATPLLLRKLHVLYLAKQKPEDFKKQLEDGTLGRQDPDIVWYHELQRKGTDDESAIIRDLVAEHLLPVEKPTFDIVCVDEAHMIRNDAAYWGLGAALLGHHARRFVAVTGTPFNNSYANVAALVGFGDATHEAASVDWWKDAIVDRKTTRKKSTREIIEWTRRWRVHDDGSPRHFLARRKEIVLKGLPTKTQGTLDVPVVKALDATLSDVDAAIAALDATQSGEFKVYAFFETQAVAYYREFCGVMLALSMGDRTPGLKAKANRLMKLMCCYFQMARSSLLHPVAPHGGRSITQTFVPKRKAYIHNKCVCCEENALEASTSIMSNLLNGVDVRRSRSPKTDGGDDDDDEVDPLPDAPPTDDGDDGVEAEDPKELVTLPKGFCDMRHKVHRRCFRELEAADVLDTPGACPRCVDLKARLKMGAHAPGEAPKLYCAKVAPHYGFATSSKLEAALDWIKGKCLRPAEADREKVIVYSFFKSSLDLIEAVLIHEQEFFAGCDAVRYDGDVSAEQRFAELERFKTAPSVNVLLATVATAGVGLNIVEANNVLFLDRWWNPTVHDQAMDRTHRLGQTRPVDVRFLDGVDTVDEVMRAINKFKSDNAQVILASEPELPRLATKSVTWKDTSKLIGDEFARIFESRARKLGIEKLMQADVFDNVPDPPAPGDPKGPRDRRQVDVPRSMQADPIRVVPKKMETDDEDCELVVVVPSDEAAAARALAGSPSAPSVIDLISDDDDDDAAPPAAPTRGWRCPACTVVNENPAFLCCATCGTERPP